MADQKISALTAATTPLAGTEVLPIVQSGATVKVSVDNLTTGKTVSASKFLGTSSDPAYFGLNSTSGTNFGYAAALPTNSVSAFVGWVTSAVNGVNGDLALVPRTSTTARILFYTGSTSASLRVTMDAAGQVAQGVAPSTWGLGKAFEINSAGCGLWGVQAGDVRLMSNATYDGAAYKYGSNGFAGMYQPTNGGSGGHSWHTAASGLAGATASFVQALTLSSAGNLKIENGNLEVGTSGKGIDFSATPGTGTSELFADYEEGTWTPGNGTNSTVNSVSSAFYTKVGRIVNAYAYFNVTTTSASITITGLPFNCTGFGPAYVYFASGTLLPFTGGSYVEAGAAYVNLNVGAIGTGAIMVSVSYMV